MGKYTTYELKVEPKYYNDVYRIIRIDGNNTLDDLCYKILSVFNFDNDHLYMFSLRNAEGYYHPAVKEEKSADEVSLNELNLKVRNKFLFLYDFGDHWLFDITVKKIEQSDILTMTFVKEQSGEISQYPDWEDEEWEDEAEEFYENTGIKNKYVFMDSGRSMSEFLVKNKPSELKSIMKVLGVKVPKVAKKASKTYAEEIVKFLISNKEKLLDLLTPSAAYYLLYVSDDNATFTPELMELLSLDVLINLGLVQISDEYESFTIEIADELYEFAEIFNNPEIVQMINKSYEWQKIITALMNIYGVADLELLHQFLCNYLQDKIDYNTLEKRVFMPMVSWGGMDVFKYEGISIATLFSKEQTELILDDRNNFDVYDYKKFEVEELSAVISNGLIDLVPSLNDLTKYFVFEKELNSSATSLLISELSVACLIGVHQDTILEMFEESLEDYSLKLTKKVKSMILKVVEEHPCSLLMGFSWSEYNKVGKKIYNQINLFDDIF